MDDPELFYSGFEWPIDRFFVEVAVDGTSGPPSLATPISKTSWGLCILVYETTVKGVDRKNKNTHSKLVVLLSI